MTGHTHIPAFKMCQESISRSFSALSVCWWGKARPLTACLEGEWVCELITVKFPGLSCWLIAGKRKY